MADYFFDSIKKHTDKSNLTQEEAKAISEAFMAATKKATKAASMSKTVVKTSRPLSDEEQLQRLKALQSNAASNYKQAAAENVSSATKGWRTSHKEKLWNNRKKEGTIRNSGTNMGTIGETSSDMEGGFRHKKPSVVQSKEILGKIRRIYKVAGSRKEHIKYKGKLIPVADYKKLMK